MQNILAVIPARGGSKGLPKKNSILVNGKPLIAYTIEDAKSAQRVGRTIVSTDDEQIAKVGADYGAQVIERPPEISGDSASSEAALSHVLDHLQDRENYEPDLVVFLQCTSPIRTAGDIDRAVETLLNNNADSLLSVVPSHRFLWRKSGDKAEPVNYDYSNRPRRQDRAPEFIENGSIYVFKPWVLRQHNNRLGGKIALFEMDFWSSFEIDSEDDLALCEWILRRREKSTRTGKSLKEMKLFVFDFDGVFTDNRVVVFQDGREAVICDRSDGFGLGRLNAAGIPILVLSKETNEVVQARCRKLAIECAQGIDNKKLFLSELLSERGIDPGQVVFVGNDVNDLECMRFAGLSAAPGDAHRAVLAEADIVLKSRGGRGAIRELCDLLLT